MSKESKTPKPKRRWLRRSLWLCLVLALLGVAAIGYLNQVGLPDFAKRELQERLAKLAGYQINAEVMRLAKPDALVMHCLPAYRGKEIDEETFEAHADTIFTQAENRLHTQKAIMSWLAV